MIGVNSANSYICKATTLQFLKNISAYIYLYFLSFVLNHCSSSPCTFFKRNVYGTHRHTRIMRMVTLPVCMHDACLVLIYLFNGNDSIDIGFFAFLTRIILKLMELHEKLMVEWLISFELLIYHIYIYIYIYFLFATDGR